MAHVLPDIIEREGVHADTAAHHHQKLQTPDGGDRALVGWCHYVNIMLMCRMLMVSFRTIVTCSQLQFSNCSSPNLFVCVSLMSINMHSGGWRRLETFIMNKNATGGVPLFKISFPQVANNACVFVRCMCVCARASARVSTLSEVITCEVLQPRLLSRCSHSASGRLLHTPLHAFKYPHVSLVWARTNFFPEDCCLFITQEKPLMHHLLHVIRIYI